MQNFENLNVYKRALNIVDDIYEITKSFPKEEIFLLTNQIRRAAISIVLNIVEGSGRTKKEFSHFLNMSRTSAFECIAAFQICLRRKYIIQNQFDNIYNELEIIIKMISKLKSSIS